MLGVDFKSAVLNLYYQRISCIKMTLRKITIDIDNSVRYIPKSEQTRERDIKPNSVKAGSLPRKQNKYFPKQ